MIVKREKYLQKLVNRKHNGMIKVVTGMRRCGKSFLLFELFDRHLLVGSLSLEAAVFK